MKNLRASIVATLIVFIALSSVLLVQQRVLNQHAIAQRPIKRIENRTIIDKVPVRKVIVDPPTQTDTSGGYSSGGSSNYSGSYSGGYSGSGSASAPSYSAPAPSYSAPTPAPAPSTSTSS